MYIIGRCPACNGVLVKEVDKEKREWARCEGCGARFPLESGYREIERRDV